MIARRFSVLMALSLASLCVSATTAECRVTVRSEPSSLLIKATSNPYEVTKVDFDNGFRFSAQVISNPPRLKTYTYFDSKDRYVLIHMADHSLSDRVCTKDIGENKVYSPRLEAELSYNCHLVCGK
jgi:hypothetical protein